MATIGRYTPAGWRDRMLILGGSNDYKTSLALHLPRTAPWDGEIVYIAADSTSPSLDSVAVADRDRIIIVTPDGEPVENTDAKTGLVATRMNWIQEANRLALTDWKAQYPKAVAVVWDTFTTTAKRYLNELSKLNFYSTKLSGDIAELAAARLEQGVYNVQQLTVEETLGFLTTRNPGLHIYALFQPAQTKPDPRSATPMCYGPEIGGQKGPVIASPKFSSQVVVKNNSGRITVETQKQSMYMAGLKVPPTAGVQVPVRVHLSAGEPDQARAFHEMVRRLKLGEPVGDVPFEVEF